MTSSQLLPTNDQSQDLQGSSKAEPQWAKEPLATTTRSQLKDIKIVILMAFMRAFRHIIP